MVLTVSLVIGTGYGHYRLPSPRVPLFLSSHHFVWHASSFGDQLCRLCSACGLRNPHLCLFCLRLFVCLLLLFAFHPVPAHVSVLWVAVFRAGVRLAGADWWGGGGGGTRSRHTGCVNSG